MVLFFNFVTTYCRDSRRQVHTVPRYSKQEWAGETCAQLSSSPESLTSVTLWRHWHKLFRKRTSHQKRHWNLWTKRMPLYRDLEILWPVEVKREFFLCYIFVVTSEWPKCLIWDSVHDELPDKIRRNKT